MAERKTEVDLKALIQREISAAEDDSTERSKRQSDALDYYQGTMSDLLAETGRSSVVSRDLADTMGWMLPGIIRVFTASEHMAVAEPVGEEDEEGAKQATDGLNFVFWKDNDGYRTIHAATWDSLLAGDGIVKTYWDDTPVYAVSFHTGLTEEARAQLVSDDDVEVLASNEGEPIKVPDPETGEETELKTYEVKIKRLKSKGRTVVECIAPEDYGIDGDAKTCQDARFQFHRREVTRSQLVEMGFDRDDVDEIGSRAPGDTEQELARDERYGESHAADRSMELLDLYECYIRVDVDDDGIAETVRCYYAGNKGGGLLLKMDGMSEPWEVWEDETPFHSIPCDPMPHRFESRSIADETMDVQKVKTVLLRQALDNLYASNNPQRFVLGKIINPEELFSPSFGGVVFGEGNAMVTPMPIPFVANHAFDAIAYQDQVIERRTGVSRQSMALDPDALQNQTATAVQSSRDAAYSQIELVARNMAELGWRSVFRAILKLEIKHRDVPRTIRLRGKFIDVDPRHWNADMDISINVGLGTGSRDRDMGMLQAIQQDQMLLIGGLREAGFEEKALEMVPLLLNTLSKKAESAGIRTPELFIPEVSPEELQAGKQMIAQKKEQGDPAAAEAQAKVQADQQFQQMKMQGDQQLGQAKLQMDQQQGAMKAQVDRMKAEAEIGLARERIQAEMALKREQLAAELQLKREQLQAELALKRELGMFSNANVSSSVSMGGEPG